MRKRKILCAILSRVLSLFTFDRFLLYYSKLISKTRKKIGLDQLRIQGDGQPSLVFPLLGPFSWCFMQFLTKTSPPLGNHGSVIGLLVLGLNYRLLADTHILIWWNTQIPKKKKKTKKTKTADILCIGGSKRHWPPPSSFWSSFFQYRGVFGKYFPTGMVIKLNTLVDID